MNKKTTIIKQNNPYEISIIIDNTALIKSLDGKTGLMNIKNNKIIGNFENYHTLYDNEKKFYIQELSDENTSIKTEYKKIRIYDAECEKMIIENFKLINVLYNSIFMYSNGKEYCIFDSEYYRENNDSINQVYDNAEEFSRSYLGQYLLVTQNGKKGIYRSGKGLVVPCIYDKISINAKEDLVFFENDDKQFFSHLGKVSNISSEYDLITVDEIKHIIYCKKNDVIYIYDKIFEKMITDFCCDEIKYVNSNDKDSMYIYKKDNKYGIVIIEREAKKISNQNKILLNNEYDEIIYKGNGIFYLKKDNKYGIYSCYKNIIIEPKYEKIDSTNFYYVYILYNGNFCDIVNVQENKTLVENCEFIKNYSSEIMYLKNNYFGLITKYDNFKIIENYDKIEYLDDHLFLLQKDSYKGICKEGNIIIPIKYEEIEQISSKTSKYSNSTFFKLKFSDDCYKLAMIKEYSNSPLDVKYDEGYCNDIQLLPDILVYKNHNSTCIFNYNHELLSMFDGYLDVSLIKIGNEWSNKRLYLIGGDYYSYKDNKFVMLPSEICNLYETIYEVDSGDVIVSSFDKKEHDYVCKEIEAGGEENIDKTISKIYRDNSNLENNFPTLVKRLKPKKMD